MTSDVLRVTLTALERTDSTPRAVAVDFSSMFCSAPHHVFSLVYEAVAFVHDTKAANVNAVVIVQDGWNKNTELSFEVPKKTHVLQAALLHLLEFLQQQESLSGEPEGAILLRLLTTYCAHRDSDVSTAAGSIFTPKDVERCSGGSNTGKLPLASADDGTHARRSDVAAAATRLEIDLREKYGSDKVAIVSSPSAIQEAVQKGAVAVFVRQNYAEADTILAQLSNLGRLVCIFSHAFDMSLLQTPMCRCDIKAGEFELFQSMRESLGISTDMWEKNYAHLMCALLLLGCDFMNRPYRYTPAVAKEVCATIISKDRPLTAKEFQVLTRTNDVDMLSVLVSLSLQISVVVSCDDRGEKSTPLDALPPNVRVGVCAFIASSGLDTDDDWNALMALIASPAELGFLQKRLSSYRGRDEAAAFY